jgi:hypothetical protein
MENSDNIKEFSARYLDFWKHFNPGRPVTKILLDTAKKYAADQIMFGVRYQDFDRMCRELEHDMSELPYSFNLVAYVCDWVRQERVERILEEENRMRQPIALPVKGTPIVTKNSEMDLAVEKLKRAGLYNWIGLLERINAKRASGEAVAETQPNCYACSDTGWVDLHGSVATCVCPRGQRIRGLDGRRIRLGRGPDGGTLVVAEATPEQCRAAAGGSGEYHNAAVVPF